MMTIKAGVLSADVLLFSVVSLSSLKALSGKAVDKQNSREGVGCKWVERMERLEKNCFTGQRVVRKMARK